MAKDIIVVQGGKSGGSAGGSKGGGSKGPITAGKSKDPLKAKLKLDDQLFWTSLTALAGIGILFHIYNTNPSLIHGFIDPFVNLGQPAPQVQTDTVPAADQGVNVAPVSTNLPYTGGDLGAISAQYQQPLNYNYPSAPSNQQSFQYPQQQPMMGQYQGYQPSQFSQGYQTGYNPTFGQNANYQTFAAKAVKHYNFDSADGMLKVTDSYYTS